MNPAGAWTWRWILKASLLGSLLAAHFLARLHSHLALPANKHNHYAQSYEYSLSFVAGRGLRQLPLPGGPSINMHVVAPLTLPDQPAAGPLKEFLLSQRDELSRDELDAYVKTFANPEAPAPPGVEGTFASSRVLDLYVAGLVWKVFGIRWQYLYAFYALVNGGACLGVFLIARRLAGGYWAGLCAATLFAASPLQAYLTTVSIRDASPLWFAIGGYSLLVCAVDRCRRGWLNGASFAALGATATLGLGWRHDAALLPPILGAGLLLVLLQHRRRMAYMLGAFAVFAGGAAMCLTGINALCNFQRVTAPMGFHIAFYGENTRCNLFGLENSFEVDWCDVQSCSEARRLAYVAGRRGADLPEYGTPPYFPICKTMYLATLRYNAYNWVSRFPQFCQLVAGGLGPPGTVQGVDTAASPWLLPAWLEAVHGPMVRPLWAALPWLFLLGVAAALSAGRAPLTAVSLLGFAAYYAALVLAVLPMQKHLALTLLPLHVFAGIGVWAGLRLCRPAVWRWAAAPFLRSRPLRWTLAGAAAAIALWGLACVGARMVSVRERSGYLRAVIELAQHGQPAPETLRGKQLFAVRVPPVPEGPMAGYLLTVSAGPHPGPLVCRHVHHRGPINFWNTGSSSTTPCGKAYRTQHVLHPNQTQYFFVSCCQGAAYGDFRPYSCAVSMEGDAEIIASTRVDLSHWNRLALSTVFCAGDRQPGSPPVPGAHSDWDWAPIPVFGRPHSSDESGIASSFSTVPPMRPLHHLVSLNRRTGAIQAALSDGASFEVQTLAAYSDAVPWSKPLLGDFDGDGLTDVVMREEVSGALWLARSDGAKLVSACWGTWWPIADWVDFGVGDFDGDGFDDLFARSRSTGALFVARSTGKRFDLQCWGHWPAQIDWQHVHVGDFNGDGRGDVAGFDPATGLWWVALAAGGRFDVQCWGQWPGKVAWQHVVMGDFDGDGRNDFAGWDPRSGQWWIALARGDHFECHPFGVSDATDAWEDVAVGDVNGDGRDDLVGRSARTGQCWGALSDGKEFKPQTWGALPGLVGRLCVADFDGDGRADVVWHDAASGALWVGRSRGSAFHFERWGTWPATEPLTSLRIFCPWR
jgi:hypothetical protein